MRLSATNYPGLCLRLWYFASPHAISSIAEPRIKNLLLLSLVGALVRLGNSSMENPRRSRARPVSPLAADLGKKLQGRRQNSSSSHHHRAGIFSISPASKSQSTS